MFMKRIVAIMLALAMLLGTTAFAAEYTVKSGDTLGKIAKSELGDASRWQEIYEANKDTVKDPNKIYVGQKLTIPGDEEPEAPAGLTDGTYTASARGLFGNVTVEVTFANGAIASVTVTDHNETADLGGVAAEKIPGEIVKHQSVLVDGWAGATFTSDAIKAAVKECITKAGGKVSDFEKEINTTGGETVEYTTDIVIVGAGAAGLMAGLTATQGGASVIFMEKAANANSSNFARCGGPAGAETVVAQQAGVTTTNKEIFDHLYDFANTTVDAKLLWEAWSRAGVAINNMVNLGINFSLDEDVYGVGYRARHSFRAPDRITPITSTIEANGGQFLFSTPGEHIIMENGAAVGMQGTDADGNTVIVHAKAVMICTGGFQGNKEMLQEYLGYANVVSLGSNMATGDGITMVLEAGGQLDRNFGVLGNEGSGNSSKTAINVAFFPGFNQNLAFWMYGGLYVDRDGDRFINEKRVADFPLALGGEAVLRQGKVYAVVDAAVYDACATEGIYSYMGKPENWKSGTALWVPVTSNAKDQLQSAIDEGWAYTSDSLAEIAAYFGLENLEKTVAEYNEMCANGEDTLFGKAANFMIPIGEGPYYVFEYEPGAWSTFGGIKTDSYLRAVDANGDAIPGLYAGGCEVGSYYAVPYYDGPGSCVGISVGSGVWAAENMLKYIGVTPSEPVLYRPGFYSASAQGFGGQVTVNLTVGVEGILSATVEGPDETSNVGGAALERLAQQIMAKGAKIDGVSGATATSNAARIATSLALAKATGAAAAEAKMKPGTYTAEAYGFALCEKLKVSVTVDETKILSIDLNTVETADTPPMVAAVVDKLIPRMMESQSVGVDAISGVTATSNGVKNAVQNCLTQALVAGGSDASAIQKFWVTPEKTGGQETIETEVLVIGMGGSGTFAAVSAMENGLQVLAIDKMGKYGGTTSLTSSLMTINPEKFQAEHNNGKDWVDAEAMRAAWLTYTEGDAKPTMVDMMIYKSGEAFDWLVYQHGFEFAGTPRRGFTAEDVYDCYYEFMPNTIGANKAYIAKYFDGIYKDFTEGGGKYMLETEAYDLITDANGNVIGAKARNLVDGTEYTINAKAVVLATGGFAGNAEMTTKYLSNEYYELKGEWSVFGLRTNDGKMIQAALDIGAGTYNIGMPPMVHNGGTVSFLPGFETVLVEGQMGARTGRPQVWSVGDLPLDMLISAYGLAVDPHGNRFANETQVNMLKAWAAGPRFYGIWSQDQVNGLITDGFKEAAAGPATIYLGYQGAIPANTPIPNAMEVLEAGIQAGIVFKADTLEELATLTGMDPANLTKTVSTYNGYCEAGNDPDYQKPAKYLDKIGAGPYYAIAGAPYCYTTCGALDINESFQVLKADGKTAIKGLFAVGTDAMGVLFTEKKEYVTFGGAANGWGLTSGYLAGPEIAKYLGK